MGNPPANIVKMYKNGKIITQNWYKIDKISIYDCRNKINDYIMRDMKSA